MGDMPLECGRAWVEIDLDALACNLADIRSKLPKNNDIMAVVKANAYGHGAERIAGRLAEEGVRAFAVATVTEGIKLRECIPDDSILVLGYTHPKDMWCLSEYNLSQLVTDEDFAKKLNETGKKIKVHIAIDTGMRRLGMEPSDFAKIERIFTFENLTVEGIATHLSSSDSKDKNDISFTNNQMEKFSELVQKLKDKGYNIGKQHAQASYGIYNYPEINLDFARPGIFLYGAYSRNDDAKITGGLRPVLALKALIAQVRWIKAGECVSYGRTYTAKEQIKLATVNIGYADGIPRQMSSNGGYCIVGGVKVPIIGIITMDMLMLDVTNAENVKAGDIATLIGKDKNEEILCSDLAEAAGTITYDILAGLSSRLPRIYL